MHNSQRINLFDDIIAYYFNASYHLDYAFLVESVKNEECMWNWQNKSHRK